MADDRNRATRATISGNTVRAAARSTIPAQPAQRSGPDPLVELARLIGQNEGAAVASAYDPTRSAAASAARRREQPIASSAGPREAIQRMTAPRESVAPRGEPRIDTSRETAPRTAEPRAPAPPRAEPRMTAAPRETAPRTAEPRAPAPPRAEPRMAAPRETTPRTAEPRAPAPPRAEPRITAPRMAEPRAPAAPRAEPRMTAPRETAPRMAEPRAPIASRLVEPRPAPGLGGAEREHHPDPRYDGYADPQASDPLATQARRSEPQTWRDADLADPYATETDRHLARKRAAGQEPAPDARRSVAAAPASAAARDTRPHAQVSPAVFDDLRQAFERYAPPADETHDEAPEAGGYHDDDQPQAWEFGHDRDVYDDYDGDGYGGGEVAYEDQSEGGRRRKVWLALALVGLAVIGTGGAYAVRSRLAGTSQAGPPPIIQADTAPKKIAAAHPGDKQLQDRLGERSETERVVPREEQPLTIKDPGLVSGIPSSLPPVMSAPSTTAATNVPGAGLDSEPKRIKTVPIRPENEPAAEAAASIPAATPAQAIPSAEPAAAAPLAVPPLPQPAPPAARQHTALASPPPSSHIRAGDYMVQLSAQKSEASARASFRVLQSKYPSVLGGQELSIKRKDLGSRGVYYGAQVGPFTSRSAAVQLCESLKAAGGTCLVQRY